MKLPLPWGFVVEGLICSAPSGCLHHWRAWRPSLLRFASSGTIDWRFLGYPCSLGRCSSPREFPGVLDCSVLSAFIWTGFFRHLLCCTVTSIAVPCLVRLWRPLFFEIACLLELLWHACLTSNRMTGCVGRAFYWTPTLPSLMVSCRCTYRCSVLAEEKR